MSGSISRWRGAAWSEIRGLIRTGKSCTYGGTLLKQAPNREGAIAFLAYLLDPAGGLKILKSMGQPSLADLLYTSPQGRGHVCVRSQDVRLVPAGTPVPAGVNALKGRVSSLVDHGSHWEAWFQADWLAVHAILSPGEAGRISPARDDCLALIAAERIHCIV